MRKKAGVKNKGAKSEASFVLGTKKNKAPKAKSLTPKPKYQKKK